MKRNFLYPFLYLLSISFFSEVYAQTQNNKLIRFGGQPAEVTITPVTPYTIRITFKPVGELTDSIPVTDGRVLIDRKWENPVVQITELSNERTILSGQLQITIRPEPLSIKVTTTEGKQVQNLIFDEVTGRINFEIGRKPVLGLGNGGQYFDRRGTYFPMQRGHRRGEYLVFGARTPIPYLIGTEGWSMFFHRPYNGKFDLRENPGRFIPADEAENKKEAPLPLDFFVTYLDSPPRALSEFANLTGKPAMPPKWALGYMQSHRNLSEAGPEGIMEVARTFRQKNLPVDALIYLGTGFTPVGWNTGHGEFLFHPQAFDEPQSMIDELHEMNYKMILHLTRPPDELRGSIPPRKDEPVDPGHVVTYWQKHKDVFSMGIDGWWPDMGDPLNNDSRLNRHYLYNKGPLMERPDERPWSLHRTGYAGMQRFGGWIWSGDINSSWETLKAHIPAGINASLSTSPFWGTDIGGFYPTEEFTGELYVRWFQFGTFTPSFRAHGVVWRTRLPWGWNPGQMGPIQMKEYLKGDTFAADTLDLEYRTLDIHTNRVEPIIKKFLELRYRLMPYLYTVVREAHDTGMPVMRALWLHYPNDPNAVSQSHEYLWGPNLLVAPITEKGVYGPHDFSMREIYLPEGKWYDFWRPYQAFHGKQQIRQTFDLSTMPIYVRAGTILPLDPVRQYVEEPVDSPMTLQIYPGTDGEFILYEDDGKSMDYLSGAFSQTRLAWDDNQRTLTIEHEMGESIRREFILELVTERGQPERLVQYDGNHMEIFFE